MASSESLIARAEPWLRANVREVARLTLPFPALGLAWWLVSAQMPPVAASALAIYAAVNLALVFALSIAQRGDHEGRFPLLVFLSIAADATLALYLAQANALLSACLAPAYLIMGLKALLLRHRTLWTIMVPALMGPLALAAGYPMTGGDRSSPEGLTALSLTLGTMLFVTLVMGLGDRRVREMRRLGERMDQQATEHRSRVAELESIATDLRVRIRRQQALEESLRAITNSLSLDDVLNQILDSMMQMLGTSRVSAAALTLISREGFTHRTLALEPTMPTGWAEPLAQHVVKTQQPVVVSDALQEREWREIYHCGAFSALSVPLIDIDGVVRGALTVVSSLRQAFTAAETRHMNSFSIQASVAIHNAELHAQLTHQRMMLEAVLRDMTDGLLVLDEHGTAVMSNTVAAEAFAHAEGLGGGLREQIKALAADVRRSGEPVLARELRVPDQAEEPERYYLAYASAVQMPEEEASHVSIVLHNITDQKAQERQRIEFISMVSHELRNPLNTLNGFLKVVLQGRAGPLNEQQEDFLSTAASQADQLKGRITELLEFNRLEAGRLRISPERASPSDLIIDVYERFRIHAQQAGLLMSVDIPEDLPDVLMDSERIGQVLTNLVENAMKATPQGGSIAIGSELCNTEVRIFVRDTGVGIAKEDQQRIFNRFYRVEKRRASQHGVHLGLGLSICQQIVESHQGRIWVDSEPGRGSTFSFTLPLVTQNQPLQQLQVS